MKKLLGIVVLGLLLHGCISSTNVTQKTSDGRSYTYKHIETFGLDNGFGESYFGECKMNHNWYRMAVGEINADIPKFAVVDCYIKLKPHELCLEWDNIYMKYSSPSTVRYLRGAVSDALVLKKENPMQCRNTNQDTKVDAEREIEKAKSKARAAKIEAENARAAAAAAERKRRCVESGAKYCR